MAGTLPSAKGCRAALPPSQDGPVNDQHGRGVSGEFKVVVGFPDARFLLEQVAFAVHGRASD